MGDEQERAPGPDGGDQGSRRRRRRRRRRRGSGGEEGSQATASPADWGDDVLLAEGRREGGGGGGEDNRVRRRRTPVELDETVVNVPASGKNPHPKRNSRARRAVPGSAGARRYRMTRQQFDRVGGWIGQLNDSLIASIYRGLGGQPHRVAGRDRLLQLTIRALGQGARIGGVVRQLHERDKKALAALLQCGGIAFAEEFHRELGLSLGGHEREWVRTMTALAERGLVFATAENVDGQFYYVIPDILVDSLVADLEGEMTLPTFASEDVRVMDHRPFCPPVDFSITTLATYIDQHRPRLTQRHEIHRHDQEQMDAFFAQIWESDSELFSFHIDFLMMHGMVELRGDTLTLNKEVTDEWLKLEPEDQRDLVFLALNKRFPLAEWVLWAIHEAGGAWVAERPLVALYRRWKRGEDWRERYGRGQYVSARRDERESFSFAPLVRIGLLEMGQWGQEKFYRLSPRGKILLEPPEDEGFSQFYLTPSFEIMAPAGLAPIILFRCGEIAELTGCDRANTYKINEVQVEKALERGWRRDDILQFLRDNSQIGVPDNVEATLKGWIGHRGDVEFHDLMLMTVHRSQIRRLEGNRRIKPYLLHRFAPGMYAVDRHRVNEIGSVLKGSGFDPSSDLRRYPGDPTQVEARQQLHKHVAEAREAAIDPANRGAAVVPPEKMTLVPGVRPPPIGTQPGAEGDEEAPQPVEDIAETPDSVRSMLDRAIAADADVEMVYLAKNGQKLTCRVRPERFAFKAEAPVLVGLDRTENERRTYTLDRIARLKMLAGAV